MWDEGRHVVGCQCEGLSAALGTFHFFWNSEALKRIVRRVGTPQNLSFSFSKLRDVACVGLQAGRTQEGFI